MKCNKCNNKAIIYVNYNQEKHLLCHEHYEEFFKEVPEGVLDWGLIDKKKQRRYAK